MNSWRARLIEEITSALGWSVQGSVSHVSIQTHSFNFIAHWCCMHCGWVNSFIENIQNLSISLTWMILNYLYYPYSFKCQIWHSIVKMYRLSFKHHLSCKTCCILTLMEVIYADIQHGFFYKPPHYTAYRGNHDCHPTLLGCRWVSYIDP